MYAKVATETRVGPVVWKGMFEFSVRHIIASICILFFAGVLRDLWKKPY